MFNFFKSKSGNTIKFHSEFGGLLIDRIDERFNYKEEIGIIFLGNLLCFLSKQTLKLKVF